MKFKAKFIRRASKFGPGLVYNREHSPGNYRWWSLRVRLPVVQLTLLLGLKLDDPRGQHEVLTRGERA